MNKKQKPEESGQQQVEKIDGRKATQFKPGQSGNPAGRPVGSGDPLKEIGRRIAQTRLALKIPKKQQKILQELGLLDNVKETELIEQIMMELATSSNPAKIAMFLERTYGKVANINVNQNNNFDFMKHSSKFTDAELEAIRDGADALDIFSTKIPDVETVEEVMSKLDEKSKQILRDLIPGIFGG